MTEGEIALARSHKELYKKLLKSNQSYFLIAEDDVAVKDDFNEPETFVKVKQFTKTNITKYRDEHKSEGIKNGQVYRVLANLCILPMIKVTKFQSILSSFAIMIGKALSDLSAVIRYGNNISLPIPKIKKWAGGEGKEFLAVSELDKQPKDTKAFNID